MAYDPNYYNDIMNYFDQIGRESIWYDRVMDSKHMSEDLDQLVQYGIAVFPKSSKK